MKKQAITRVLCVLLIASISIVAFGCTRPKPKPTPAPVATPTDTGGRLQPSDTPSATPVVGGDDLGVNINASGPKDIDNLLDKLNNADIADNAVGEGTESDDDIDNF